MHKNNIIYLMGAGRSGTTAIATLLGNHKEILTLGEMHQFYDHIRDSKPCSCGERLDTCEFWSDVLAKLPEDLINNPDEYQKMSDQLEYHSSIPKHFLGLTDKEIVSKYNKAQYEIFETVNDLHATKYLLDSAKYVGRNLSLKKNKDLNLKTIFIVRDVRGLINSFSKKVQSSRTPLNTVFYYLSVNFVSEFVYMFRSKKKIIKFRYEDFSTKPEKCLQRLGAFLEVDMQDLIQKVKNNDSFEIGHIIGGNRLKSNKEIKLNFDEDWKSKIPRHKQIAYYFLAFPLMIFNWYKI